MKVTEKFQEIVSYQSDNFCKWFGDDEYQEEPQKNLYSTTFSRPMNDKEIMDELNWSEVSLSDVFNHLKNASHDSWMIFYCKDSAGVLRAVVVHWYGVGWRVHANEVTDPGGWYDGDRVFSRNSVLKPSDTSQSLNLSDSLTIAIETVKKAGYLVYKQL